MNSQIFSEEHFFKPTKELLENKQISSSEYENIIQQYQNNQKRKQIQNFVSSSSIKNRLLLYIKSHSHFQSEKNIQNFEEVISSKSINTEDTSKQGQPKKEKNTKSSFIPSFESIAILKQIQNIEQIDIQSFSINTLDFSPGFYLPFTVEVLKKVPYFYDIKVPQQKFYNFIDSLICEYQKHNNPYHNYQHGIAVMHNCYLFGKMQRTGKLLSPLDYFALVFGGLCHDAGHTGFNNDFQIKISSQKALIWNDRSVLENYHVYISMKLLSKTQNNFLQQISQEDFRHFRKMMINNILATDMKDHIILQSNFENKLKNPAIDVKSDQNVKLVCGILTHASDLSSCVKKVDIAQAWSKRINLQMANQYRQQGRRGIAQSNFMKDLDVDPIAANKNQIGFLSHFVRPLYKAINDYEIQDKLVHLMLQNMEQGIKKCNKQLQQLQKQKNI